MRGIRMHEPIRRPPMVAVVNHDTVFLGMMAEFLSDEGYVPECLIADEHSFAHLRAVQPDLAILDISVHRRDAAWALVEEMCAHETTRHIPVVVCTADDIWAREHAGSIDMRGCTLVEKPFNLADLHAIIERLLAAAPARN
jgi:DNA-binding response OmpR family regulator